MSKITSLPIIKNIWTYIREQKILKKHNEVSTFWEPVIAAYVKKELTSYQVLKKKNISSTQIIWQYWGQGIDVELPEVVRACFSSVDKHKGNWIVIRLDDSTISEYVQFPDFVNQKLKSGTFTKTFFSDLLRVALLDLYGGIWLDATILMTGPISNQLTSFDYFMYQRDFKEKHKFFWKNSYAYYWNWNSEFKVNALSSIFFSQQNGQVVHTLLDLMLYYWETQVELMDYFVFQILIDDLMNGYLKDSRCEVVSDVIPHVLQTKFNGLYPYVTMEEALQNSNLHKMSYFEGNSLNNFRVFVEEKSLSI